MASVNTEPYIVRYPNLLIVIACLTTVLVLTGLMIKDQARLELVSYALTLSAFTIQFVVSFYLANKCVWNHDKSGIIIGYLITLICLILIFQSTIDLYQYLHQPVMPQIVYNYQVPLKA